MPKRGRGQTPIATEDFFDTDEWNACIPAMSTMIRKDNDEEFSFDDIFSLTVETNFC